jgi:ankyrin repeat protein
VAEEKYDVTRYLLENSADATFDGSVSLFYACKNNRIDIVQMLFDYGSETDSLVLNSEHFIVACKNNSYDIVKLLISRNVIIPERAILVAAQFSSEDIMLSLIENGIDVNTSINNIYPLLVATALNRPSIVNVLINKGVNIRVDDDKCYLIACKDNYLEILKLFIARGNDLALKDIRPFFLACSFGHLDLVEYMYSLGSKFDNTCIFGAIEYNHTKVLQFLFLKYELSQQVYDESLVLCASKGNTFIAEYLLKNVQFTDSIKNEAFITCIGNFDMFLLGMLYTNTLDKELAAGKAAMLGFVDGLSFLIDLGLDLNSTYVQAGFVKACKYNLFNIIQVFVENDFILLPDYKEVAFIEACFHEDAQIARYIYNNNLVRSVFIANLINDACIAKNFEMVKTLFNSENSQSYFNEENIEIVDEDIEYLIEHGVYNIIKVIVEYDNFKQINPRYIIDAVTNGNLSIVKLLLSNYTLSKYILDEAYTEAIDNLSDQNQDYSKIAKLLKEYGADLSSSENESV